MSPRQTARLLHRYVGLVLAGFLILAGLTGSLLAWNDELEALLAPELFVLAGPAPDAKPLDGLRLRDAVLARYPQADVTHVPLRVTPGRSVSFMLAGSGMPLAIDQVMVDPYTGRIMGARKWGQLDWHGASVMPFIYRLHQSLALGVFGSYLFGIVALLWSLDCFVGLYLTFPPRARDARKRWGSRWWPAWKIRRGVSGYKRLFDLHRALSLWFWACLLVLAWSSVAFNLSEVYDPVMQRFFDHQGEQALLERAPRLRPPPALNREQARSRGRVLMAALAARHGFIILREDMLAFDARRAIYRYDVRSSLDLRLRSGSTQVYFDADSGQQLAVWLPTGAASGDTIRTWITSLHMAAIWGWPLKIFISLTGLIVVLAAVTGVLIWWRKRHP